MTVLTEEIRAEIRRLYVPYAYGYAQVARRVGVSPTTVYGVIHPETVERTRRLSREAKRRRVGTCRECGAQTSYSGRRGVNGPSRLCKGCGAKYAAQLARERTFGKGPVQTKIFAFLESGPKRFMEIYEHLDIPKDTLSPRLDRLLRQGLIVRESRGVYRLP